MMRERRKQHGQIVEDAGGHLTASYRAVIVEAGVDEFLVTFPDVPEAITQGSSLEEAQASAPDALVAALQAYIALGRPLPAATLADDLAPGAHVLEVAVRL